MLVVYRVSLVHCNIVITTNFLFLRKLRLKVRFEGCCEIMELQQKLNIITRILKQILGLQCICRDDFILNIKGNQGINLFSDLWRYDIIALNQRFMSAPCCNNMNNYRLPLIQLVPFLSLFRRSRTVVWCQCILPRQLPQNMWLLF